MVGAVVEARAELRIHRMRVLLSLVGVGVAVAALTSVVGLGAIAQQSTVESFERSGGRPATLSAQVYSETGQPIATDAVAAAVDVAVERYGIGHSSSSGSIQQRVQFADGVSGVNLQLVGVDYATIHRLVVTDGAWFADGDADRLAPALIVNEAFWQRLGSPDLRTHPTVRLAGADGATAVIIGISTGVYSDPLDPAAFMLREAHERIADPAQLAGAQLAWEFWVPEQSAEDLTMALKRDIAGSVGTDVTVDIYRSDFAAFNDGEDPLLPIKLIVLGVAVLILFLGALSLVNISLVTVRQRIREIGIRRSFGATAGRVFFAVMMESVVGTIVAGAIGVFIAVLVVENPQVQQLIAQGATDLPPFPIEAALIGLGASAAVGALAGLLPAIVAVRVRVIDAIRY
ncbi:MAG: transporter permease [Microbacteriaceae bacterium]|jgi:putative ABC transport system permease protein|nr:transporter permease [Microbacteriaceae bacterium]